MESACVAVISDAQNSAQVVALVGLEKVVDASISVVSSTELSYIRVVMDGRICEFEEAVDIRLSL